jgi:S-adenosylmethionine hydrolase
MKVITLTTDFGHSEYVAQMKGVIHGIAPQARIVDVSHDITPQNIIEGAFVLMTTLPYFKEAIHVAVIDPGVGSSRRAVLIECQRGLLIGPDNGLLLPVARKLGIRACHHILNKDLMLPKVSSTFHGRDIFAPVAAHVCTGIEPKEVGMPIKEGSLVGLDIELHELSETWAKGMVVRVDRFGNVITNIPEAVIGPRLKKGLEIGIHIGEKESLAKAMRTYDDGKKGEMVALFSSSGHLEIGVREGSAKAKLGARPGDRVLVKF